MIACVQRVLYTSVHVGDKAVSEIGPGLLVFLGIEDGDDEQKVRKISEKICNLRIFPDEAGKMSLSVKDTGGSVMVISQFTLAASTEKGNRPDFNNAAAPVFAEPLYERCVTLIGERIGRERTAKGVFGADMKISLLNDGPVTILLKK